jgi:hypothetical protein
VKGKMTQLSGAKPGEHLRHRERKKFLAIFLKK